jgi:hypothetical protein
MRETTTIPASGEELLRHATDNLADHLDLQRDLHRYVARMRADGSGGVLYRIVDDVEEQIVPYLWAAAAWAEVSGPAPGPAFEQSMIERWGDGRWLRSASYFPHDPEQWSLECRDWLRGDTLFQGTTHMDLALEIADLAGAWKDGHDFVVNVVLRRSEGTR